MDERDAPSDTAFSRGPYATIVVALDRSALAESVLPYVTPLARAFHSTVVCVCAVMPINPTPITEVALPSYVPFAHLEHVQHEIREDDLAYLEGIRDRLGGLDVVCMTPEGNPAEALVELARARHADLIAMTTQGHSGPRRALMGSVADEILRTAPCPVLLVRPDTASRHQTSTRQHEITHIHPEV